MNISKPLAILLIAILTTTVAAAMCMIQPAPGPGGDHRVGTICVGCDLHQLVSGGVPGALICANAPECLDDPECILQPVPDPNPPYPDPPMGTICVGPDLYQLWSGGEIGTLICENYPACMITPEPVPDPEPPEPPVGNCFMGGFFRFMRFR